MERSDFIVVAEDQRADADAGAARIGPPDHGELLPVGTLHLEPVGLPARPVGRRSPLRDDALELLLACGLVEPCAVANDVVAVPDLGPGLGEQPRQRRLALLERAR